MLSLTALSCGYDGGTVLHDVTLTVEPGHVHAILGHNGAGKTTLLNAAAGLVPATSGKIKLNGRDLTGRPPHHVARNGVRLVPQGRRVFASLTVAEHFRVAYRPARGRAAQWTPQRTKDLLPRLSERWSHRGGQLSGGEQQMLAIARALLGQPTVLLLDEPTEGLAPAVTRQILGLIRPLAEDGLAILLTAPQPALVTDIADQTTVLRSGRVAASGPHEHPHTLIDALAIGELDG
ncbi:ABC transporter ATP-binding protein [Actinocrispum wychmicini]|uniref:Branched-chain amino acid transport system ATP-binding protein n=1 Tax=Actinocrispum wychmicini TaxID=1213861 RepID=A0A4V2S5Z3_9PSEU|nr:ABC transporter ATP-binding protein [Actinocrispum wychmicini]TCO54050.1 branched-chain amino acid transport system ATP-binding protein [Actinocrispum wychmicini]